MLQCCSTNVFLMGGSKLVPYSIGHGLPSLPTSICLLNLLIILQVGTIHWNIIMMYWSPNNRSNFATPGKMCTEQLIVRVEHRIFQNVMAMFIALSFYFIDGRRFCDCVNCFQFYNPWSVLEFVIELFSLNLSIL